eukprot:9058119-Pyramimonas_sp.AAC.1
MQDLSLTKYADDLTKKLVGGRFTSLRELIELSRRSNDDLDESLLRDGYKQNLSKQDTLVCLVGRGSSEALRLLREGALSFPGRAAQIIKSLGFRVSAQPHRYAVELKARCNAMQSGFYSMGIFWQLPGIPHRLRRCLFMSKVYNAGLSGIEAYVPTGTEYRRLTNQIASFARRAMR